MEAVNHVNSFIIKHKKKKTALIAILQDIQTEYNYLPKEALHMVSQSLGIPLIDVISVATFYRAFSLKPRGQHLVTVCSGTACHVRGGPKVLEEFEKKLTIKAGDTTNDGRFTLETVACLGCCAIGPVIVVDGNYYAQTTARKVDSILQKYRKKRVKK
ncbi:MAG: NADH-quinone oxidoreductase subunit NuoE [Candidatus Aminicenantales bacterium]